ncbi:MAG: hypothetical protein ACE5OZ_06110 [Candidatus Heimdallarchaeota archaeon]
MSLDSFVEEQKGRMKKQGDKQSNKKAKLGKKKSNLPHALDKWDPEWFQEFSKGKLYEFLRETVERKPLFANYVVWTKKILLPQTSELEPQEIASLLGITLGEAFIILDKIFKEDGASK